MREQDKHKNKRKHFSCKENFLVGCVSYCIWTLHINVLVPAARAVLHFIVGLFALLHLLLCTGSLLCTFFSAVMSTSRMEATRTRTQQPRRNFWRISFLFACLRFPDSRVGLLGIFPSQTDIKTWLESVWIYVWRLCGTSRHKALYLGFFCASSGFGAINGFVPRRVGLCRSYCSAAFHLFYVQSVTVDRFQQAIHPSAGDLLRLSVLCQNFEYFLVSLCLVNTKKL